MFEAIPTINWMILAPALVTALTGCLALLLEMFFKNRPQSWMVTVTVLGMAVSTVLYIGQSAAVPFFTLSNCYVMDRQTALMGAIISASTALTALISDGYLKARNIPYGEFYALICWSAFGAQVMASTTNLITIFVGLEILSIALYVLASLNRLNKQSQESGLKYFLLGAFASSFLLFGMAFLYGATGSLQLGDVTRALATNDPMATMFVTLGVALIIVGLGFKCGFVPFHQWTPDVYEGAPTNVTAFMASVSKVAAFVALWRVLDATRDIRSFWLPLLSAIAILTMVVGNVVACWQKDVKRIMGYSSISNAGYLLAGLVAEFSGSNPINTSLMGFFLLNYAFTTIGAFAILATAAVDGEEDTSLKNLRGLYKRAPFLGACLLLLILSMIGIPPTSGFFAKALIFATALNSHQVVLAIVLGITSVISIYYYLGILVAAFVSDRTTEERAGSGTFAIKLTAAICAASAVVITFALNSSSFSSVLSR